MQAAWIARYKDCEAAGLEFYCIIELDRKAVGTVRLYDFQGDSFSWGSQMIVSGAPSSAAIASALLVYEFAFYTLGFKRSHFSVRILNERVVASHQRFGAKIDHSDDLDYFFTYGKADCERTRSRYTRFLPVVLENDPSHALSGFIPTASRMTRTRPRHQGEGPSAG